jgi:uncharacterized protein (DUF433 family)
MTIKWVKVDPLVMRGEPFCYNTRLTVRQLLELRRSGYGVAQLLREHPELRVVGIAQAYRYAAEHRDMYARVLRPQRRPGRPRLHRRRGIDPAGGVAPPGRRRRQSEGRRPRLSLRRRAGFDYSEETGRISTP